LGLTNVVQQQFTPMHTSPATVVHTTTVQVVAAAP
jgi:hypothetical protein